MLALASCSEWMLIFIRDRVFKDMVQLDSDLTSRFGIGRGLLCKKWLKWGIITVLSPPRLSVCLTGNTWAPTWRGTFLWIAPSRGRRCERRGRWARSCWRAARAARRTAPASSSSSSSSSCCGRRVYLSAAAAGARSGPGCWSPSRGMRTLQPQKKPKSKPKEAFSAILFFQIWDLISKS